MTKNTAAANRIIAELIIQPMPIDNNVSTIHIATGDALSPYLVD